MNSKFENCLSTFKLDNELYMKSKKHPEKTCDPISESEMKYNFKNPKVKKPTATRASRFEQFLWHEFYDEYIRAKETLEKSGSADNTTEYIAEYGKEPPNAGDAAMEELINKYPLHATRAITLWNKNGDVTRSFKRCQVITKPTAECDQQFG